MNRKSFVFFIAVLLFATNAFCFELKAIKSYNVKNAPGTVYFLEHNGRLNPIFYCPTEYMKTWDIHSVVNNSYVQKSDARDAEPYLFLGNYEGSDVYLFISSSSEKPAVYAESTHQLIKPFVPRSSTMKGVNNKDLKLVEVKDFDGDNFPELVIFDERNMVLHIFAIKKIDGKFQAVNQASGTVDNKDLEGYTRALPDIDDGIMVKMVKGKPLSEFDSDAQKMLKVNKTCIYDKDAGLVYIKKAPFNSRVVLDNHMYKSPAQRMFMSQGTESIRAKYLTRKTCGNTKFGIEPLKDFTHNFDISGKEKALLLKHQNALCLTIKKNCLFEPGNTSICFGDVKSLQTLQVEKMKMFITRAHEPGGRGHEFLGLMPIKNSDDGQDYTILFTPADIFIYKGNGFAGCENKDFRKMTFVEHKTIQEVFGVDRFNYLTSKQNFLLVGMNNSKRILELKLTGKACKAVEQW